MHAARVVLCVVLFLVDRAAAIASSEMQHCVPHASLPPNLTLYQTTAGARQAETQSDLDFIREALITTEVNIARVFNHDVKTRREVRVWPCLFSAVAPVGGSSHAVCLFGVPPVAGQSHRGHRLD